MKKGEQCPYGKDYKFSHNKKKFDQDGKPKQSAAQSSKPTDSAAASSGSDGWGQPVGLKSTTCIKLLVEGAESEAPKQIASHQSTKVAAVASGPGLVALKDLPAEW